MVIMLPFLESPSGDSHIKVTGMLLRKLKLIPLTETNVAVAQALTDPYGRPY